jgi:hypothetical protein
MGATPDSSAWSRRCASARRTSGSKHTSRGARSQGNFTVPFHSGSPENGQSPSSPAVIDAIDHTSMFMVSLRVCWTNSRFLARILASFRGLAGVRRRSTWLPAMLRRVSRQTTATIVFSRTWGSRKVYSRIPGGQKTVSPPRSDPPASSRRWCRRGGGPAGHVDLVSCQRGRRLVKGPHQSVSQTRNEPVRLVFSLYFKFQ